MIISNHALGDAVGRTNDLAFRENLVERLWQNATGGNACAFAALGVAVSKTNDLTFRTCLKSG